MAFTFHALTNAPGPIRTANLRVRSALLYPLSYEGPTIKL